VSPNGGGDWMGVKSLYIMSGGKLTLDKNLLVRGVQSGPKIEVPILMSLIVCDEGNVLFDTGLHSGGIKDRLGVWGERVISLCSPHLGREEVVENKLKEIGLEITDIDIVVNSHLHWDHVGGNRLFTKSRILVQNAEYRFAQYPDAYAKGSFLKNHFDHEELNYDLIEGDYQIFDGVFIILTPGHTPGHQSLVVRLKNTGTVILPGDALPMRENLEGNLLPGPVWGASEAYHSILRLKNISNVEKGQIFFSHDLEFAENIKLSPEFYD
jgi:N-acyl homoserine lactone hydrolase